MLLIWQGAGGLVILIGIVAAVLTNLLSSSLFQEDNYFQRHAWVQAVALWGAGAACWFLGRYLHGRPGRILMDKATGEEVTIKPNHSLFFIKIEYWGPIFFVLGLAVWLRAVM
jgi:hypothetical protein